MIGSAYLRVFEPIEALPARERVLLEERAPAAAGERPVYRHLGGPAARLGLLERATGRPEVRTEGGRTFVCPPRTQIRRLTAMLALRDTVAPEVAEALLPEAEARRVARDLARIRRRHPQAAPSILESPWQVPLPWFVLFEGGERRISDRAEGGYAVTYWTPLDRARSRVRRAAGILRRGELDQVADSLAQIDDWLGCFVPESRVELDYGGAAAGMGWNELDDDHSARDLQEALTALERGDLERAGALYGGVASRWAEAKIRESLN